MKKMLLLLIIVSSLFAHIFGSRVYIKSKYGFSYTLLYGKCYGIKNEGTVCLLKKIKTKKELEKEIYDAIEDSKKIEEIVKKGK